MNGVWAWLRRALADSGREVGNRQSWLLAIWLVTGKTNCPLAETMALQCLW